MARSLCCFFALLVMTHSRASEFLSIPLDSDLFEFDYETLIMSDFTYTDGLYRQDDAASYFEPRRMELELGFEYTRRFSVKLELEYDYDDRDFGVKDAFVDLDLPNRYRLKIGRQKQVFGISRSSSSKNLLTIERPVSNDLLQLDRTTGILFEKSIGDTTLQVGVFRREDDGNNIDSSLVRALYEPEIGENKYWHMGLTLASEAYDGAQYRIKSKGSADVIGSFLKSEKVDAEKVNYFGLDTAWRNGRFSLIGEYLRNRVIVSGENDLEYDGGYLQASWFLTNDRHRFRDGRFRGVRPSSNYALEIVTPYSMLDTYEFGKGFEVENLSVGLNYYHSADVKLMAEFNLSKVGKGKLEEQSGRAVLLRLQLEF